MKPCVKRRKAVVTSDDDEENVDNDLDSQSKPVRTPFISLVDFISLGHVWLILSYHLCRILTMMITAPN